MNDRINSAPREQKYFQAGLEYKQTEPLDLAKENQQKNAEEKMHELKKDIDAKDNQEKINALLAECKEGECQTEEVLKNNGYIPYEMGKFENPKDVHPGHIGFLFANNVLLEGRPLVVGKLGNGYTFYHKA